MALLTDDSERGRRALELAVTAAFFHPGSAAQIASALSTKGRRLHAADVTRIWRKAKRSGALPKITRPANGPTANRRRA